MKIIKRNASEESFDANKIIIAISKANNEVPDAERISKDAIISIAKKIEKECEKLNRAVNIEEIQDLVENHLIEEKFANVAKKYIKYRYERELVRKSNTTDDKILSLISGENEEVKTENSNKNPTIASVQRDYMAGEVSRDLTTRLFLPKDVVKAHKDGLIHFHDSDFFAQKIHNCCLVNLEDMLQNGTVISGTLIEKPHSFSTACNISTQIIAQVASSQYGGQSISLAHLAPFVNVSRKKIRKNVENELFNSSARFQNPEELKKYVSDVVEKRVREEVERGVQMLQYQVITLMTTNGQAPFVTVFMYLNEVQDSQTKDDLALIIEEVLKQRFKGIKNEKGVLITPAFPKLIYVLEEDNITENSKYWYLTELAAKCTAKRMVPDYISEKIMKKLKDGNCFPVMGCRSALSPWYDKKGKAKFYGRFNQGVVTINLPDVALSAKGDINTFWKILDERLELCHKALRCRHERLKGTKTDVAPILWRHGALARLKQGEEITELLYGGYSSISLGYAGLWECVYALSQKKLTEKEGEELGLKIMQTMNDYCEKWKADENIGYSIYGTPLESTTYKFARSLQQRFGKIPNVTDKNYITNSYHIHVTEPIDAFSKLEKESKFQALSPGGAISYIEVPNMQHNIPAVLEIIKFIYNSIMYAELNIKSDYCQKCGWEREIAIVKDEHGQLVWECPNCKNRDQTTMNVARRTCGYIGTEYWNQGRTQEIQERYTHI